MKQFLKQILVTLIFGDGAKITSKTRGKQQQRWDDEFFTHSTDGDTENKIIHFIGNETSGAAKGELGAHYSANLNSLQGVMSNDWFSVLALTKVFAITENRFRTRGVPTFSNDADAAIGGLSIDDMYFNSTLGSLTLRKA